MRKIYVLNFTNYTEAFDWNRKMLLLNFIQNLQIIKRHLLTNFGDFNPTEVAFAGVVQSAAGDTSFVNNVHGMQPNAGTPAG